MNFNETHLTILKIINKTINLPTIISFQKLELALPCYNNLYDREIN